MAVTADHARVYVDSFFPSTPEWAFRIMASGELGVDFFFVLSGFIILHAHGNDARTPAAARRYAIKRLARIFLPYWPMGLGILAVLQWWPAVSEPGHEPVAS